MKNVFIYRKSAYDVYAPQLVGQIAQGSSPLPSVSPGLGPPGGAGSRRPSFRALPSNENMQNDNITSPENIGPSSLSVDEDRPMRRRGSQLYVKIVLILFGFNL